jgi:uncharacterized protein
MTQTAEISEVEFTTEDGILLSGDVAIPAHPRMAAIICHPHPQYGGNRYNNVVSALFKAFAGAEIAALRFDFRGQFDDGRGEALDAKAALDALTAAVPGVDVVATGYSFGGAIALGLDDVRIVAKVLVAPPLAVMGVSPGTDVPTLVLTPDHDQFSPPEKSGPIVAEWRSTIHESIAGADHFLAAGTAIVTARALTFLGSIPLSSR